jgi:hypothetical protein
VVSRRYGRWSGCIRAPDRAGILSRAAGTAGDALASGLEVRRRSRSAQQHGRGRVQARRPRPDLPQVHLGRLRGEARRARGQKAEGRRSRGPRRVPRRQHLLGAEGGALAHLKANAPQPTIGKLVDDAMDAIERDNPTLKGVLPKDYARPGLDKQRSAADQPGQRHRLGTAGPRRRTRSAASTSTSWPASPAPRARAAASSTRRPRGARAGRDARAVQGPRLRPVLRLRRHVRAAARSSSRRTAARSATSRSTGRSRTTRPGASRR